MIDILELIQDNERMQKEIKALKIAIYKLVAENESLRMKEEVTV